MVWKLLQQSRRANRRRGPTWRRAPWSQRDWWEDVQSRRPEVAREWSSEWPRAGGLAQRWHRPSPHIALEPTSATWTVSVTAPRRTSSLRLSEWVKVLRC